ncbi:PREDICTED: potassium channel subfamily U member 1 [Dipodomys ordii]|uniref:Potassium channel subfamily U member 1 n=1 Tax=Dipodomys ordii TaxID=10020 RepID=A0A1S3FTH0_DIPOR|nr:PREDICTED: potassium channel subfamily U member 1 [Dipodomys ordii]
MPGRKPQLGNGEQFGKIFCSTEIQAAFILSSFVTFFSGLAILYIFRLLWKFIKKHHKRKEKDILNLISSRASFLRRLYINGAFRDRIEMLLSAQTFVGQVFVLLVFVLSIGSLIIYFINSTDPVGSCSSYDDITIPIDLIFNAFFSFYFGLRFLAAGDKIKFWVELNSIVDIFTVPPAFISYYLKSNWLGLRFLRALRLLELPQILQILQVIKTSNSVKLSKLLAIILSTWFTAAGFIHLVENSGDPWLKDRNAQNMSYFDSIYLVVATTSTVGFGDVVARTSLGRAFIMFFTLGSLVLFANYVPEMVELFANKKKFTTSYQVVKGKKFIVVCGNITVDSVTAFLRNFLRHKAGEINTEIVFLGEVLSIKNYYPKTRIIIQILHSHNKVFLPKIPNWNWSAGDNIICFAELKLGFIAQGCSVPGLCTLLTSLFIEQNKKVTPKLPWQKYFLSGLKNKILTQRLSDDFAGMSFPEASRLCYVKMNLMLIAIEYQSMFRSSYSGLILNPPAQVKLLKNTLGFFIAESLKEVKRALFYCSTCHRDVCTPEMITKCGCKSKTRQQGSGLVVLKRNMKDYSTVRIQDSFPRGEESLNSNTRIFQHDSRTENDDQLDSSGMYHWCKSTPLEKVILKRSSKYEFRNHIVACVFGDAHSTLMGLRNFVIPLRASNFTRQELKDIVFIGSLDYLEREWRFIRNFPQIFILPGSALYIGDLHTVNIEDCSMCTILAPSPKPCSSPTLVDTEAIMATLNIGSLRIATGPQESSATEGITSEYNECSERKFRRVPILTELKNPSNIHFIEQLGGLEGTLTGTSLHLSTSFAIGAVFSGSFLDSLLATAFYNYHVLELLHMLVTGGISFQLEQHLDNEKLSGLPESSTFLSGRMRCKMGLLSLDQTILSDIQPRRTFGQLFCGSLDNFGILCIGLYRMIDDEENNPEHRRGVCWFVITRPSIQFKLLPTDLVFCAIPFNTDCCKKDNDVSATQAPYEIINIAPLTSETQLDLDRPAATDLMEEKSLHMFYSQVYPLESSTSHFSESHQTVLGNKQLGENVESNGKENIQKEGTVLTPT